MKEVIVRSCFDLQRLRKAIYAVGLVAAPCVSGIAVAEDDRFIIQVDETHKGLVMAMSKSKGGLLKQEGRGFFAAEFKGKSLAQVPRQLSRRAADIQGFEIIRRGNLFDQIALKHESELRRFARLVQIDFKVCRLSSFELHHALPVGEQKFF